MSCAKLRCTSVCESVSQWPWQVTRRPQKCPQLNNNTSPDCDHALCRWHKNQRGGEQAKSHPCLRAHGAGGQVTAAAPARFAGPLARVLVTHHGPGSWPSHFTVAADSTVHCVFLGYGVVATCTLQSRELPWSSAALPCPRQRPVLQGQKPGHSH